MTVTSFHPASDADDTLAYRTHLQTGRTGLNWASGLRLVDRKTLGHSHFRGSAFGALVHFLTLARRRPIFRVLIASRSSFSAAEPPPLF
jgi:hypothetical protein